MMEPETADKIFNRMMGVNRNPNSGYLEIEPAQVRMILDSLVSEDEKRKVNMCSHCPFATAQGKYYCVLSARTIPDEYSIPSWCQLRKGSLLIELDKED